MTRLVDLDPKWLRYEKREDGGAVFMPSTMTEAHGIRFLCPKCFTQNSGPVGTHGVICWSRSRGTPDNAKPGPGRWTFHGTGFEDLTLEGDPVGTARSVALTGGCAWHGFITNGEAA